MALTRQQVRTLVRRELEDVTSEAWSEADLDLLVSLVYDSLWGEILRFAPYFLSQTDTVDPLTSPGYIDTKLVADGGQLSQRFFRVQTLVRNGIQLTPTDPKFVTLEANVVKDGPSFQYYKRGDRIYLFPLKTDSTELTYSYRPTAFTSLAETGTVVMPDGHDLVLVLQAAARGAKGDRKAELQNDLALARQNMFADIERTYVGSVQPLLYDDGAQWGATN